MATILGLLVILLEEVGRPTFNKLNVIFHIPH